jgi:hypothetical protein
MAVGLNASSKVVVHGTSRAGKAVAVVIEGEELSKHLLHRARKGRLIARKIKPVLLG